jgi:transcriptional regulator with XRE-family HTH domain
MYPEMSRDFGSRLRDLRKQSGLTQKEFGAKFGLAESTISGYESGSRTPDLEYIRKFAEFFGVTTDYLISGDESPDSNPGASIAQPDVELEELLAEFKRQLESRNLTDEEKKMVLDAVTDAIWKTRES